MDCTRTNGRVNLMQPDTHTLFSMMDPISTDTCTSYNNAMAGNWYNTELSTLYFSDKNIAALQFGIKQGVYRKSSGQYVIGNQSCDELKTVMRSVFLQYSKNNPTSILEQIRDLNSIVLEYAVNQVYGEAQGYMKYKYDVSTLVTPLSYPILSKTNDKQLFLKSFF